MLISLLAVLFFSTEIQEMPVYRVGECSYDSCNIWFDNERFVWYPAIYEEGDILRVQVVTNRITKKQTLTIK